MIPNPWVIVGVLVLWAASLVGVGKWQREDGRTAERVAWQARDAKELREANVEIDRLHTLARAKEREHVDDMANVGTNFQRSLQDAEQIRRRDVAAAHSGALRLRVPTSCEGAGRDPAGPAGSASRLGDGSAGGELPRAIAADLLGLAHDADGVAAQLAACQAVILADRK